MTKANTDRALIRRFLAGDGTPLPIDSNALAADLGGVLEAADAESGTIALAFAPGERYLQGNGALQGGIVATMLDFAIAFAGLARLPDERHGVTASITVNLLKPPLAGHYRAVARLDRVGMTMVFASAQLVRTEDDSLVATATAVLPVVAARRAS
jgi:uncharacterized protein (TIGR00369 family)